MASRATSYRDDLMRGRIRVESKASSNIVRVFVSSTFADMSDERNVLYNNAYPELRNFCQNLGLEFQVIDMRWGIRDTASVDHSTTSLCLLEVRTCKKVSLGPYFVVFLGNRYGYQPLPTAINETEFKVLQQIVKEEAKDPNCLLDKWYKLDRNNIPQARILEPITNHFPHFDDTNPEIAEKREAEKEGWNEVFKELSCMLRYAAEIALKRGLLPKESQLNLSKSITQMEVEEALQETEGSALLAYSREISDLHKHTNEEKAKLFVDFVEGEEKIDKSRQKMLKALKKMVKLHIEEKKMFKKYEVSWKSLNSPQDDEKWKGGGYLQDFCKDFLSDLKTSIVNGLNQKEGTKKMESSEDILLEEVIHHARFEVLKTIDFCGREQLIGKISDSILQRDNRHPIVLVGRSGCGKTSLIAKLVETQRKRSPRPVIVYRFLGTSPDSSNIHKLLTSLILQISTVYGEEIPASHLLQNFADVVDHFSRLLRRVSKRLEDKDEDSLVIFLDSIDQLSVEDGAHRMTWLPKKTPDKVSIILSSLPEPDFEVVPTMRKYVPDTNIHAVHGLTVETAKEVLQKCLSNEGRQLTESQTTKILSAFEKFPYPLFLKLMLEEAKRWRSHDDLEDLELPNTARSAILRFYERLEKEHGRTFTSKAIGFIVAARDGVTENELQDLLSLDDEVLYDVYEHWSPPLEDTVRIPAFTWTRLNYDLSKYIVQRQATGHTVLALYHRQFIEVAREKYLQPSDAAKVYKILSEYFQGTFAEGTLKRLELKMWGESRDVDRRVAKQPTQFSSNVFNVRKLRELPFCLLKGKSLEELKINVLGNPEWILTKIQAFSIKEVIEDYNMALKEDEDMETRLIRDAIKLAKPTLEFPGGPLRTTITGFKTPVTYLEFLYEENLFVAGSSDGVLMVWDTNNDEVLHKIEAHSGPVTCVTFSEPGAGERVASCSKDKSVKMFYLDNGNQCFHQSLEELENSELAELIITKESLLCVTDFKIRAWDTVTKDQIFEKESSSANTCVCDVKNIEGINVIVGQEDGKCRSFNALTGKENASSNEQGARITNIFAITAEEDTICVVVWQNGRISLLNATSLEEQDTIESNERVIDSCGSRFEENFVVAFSDKVNIFSVKSRKIKIDYSLSEHDCTISKVRFASKVTLAVAYDNRKVVVWDLASDVKSVASSVWEGMGAPIDHMKIGQHVGVTGSNKVFYLKVWDLKHQDAVKLDPALPLHANTSALNCCGKYIAYAENGKVIVRNVDDFVNGAQTGTNQVVPGVDVKNIMFIKFAGQGDSLLIVTKDGTVKKYHGREEGNGTLELLTEEETTFSEPGSKFLLMSISNDRKAIVLLSETKADSVSLICLNEENFCLLRRMDLSKHDVEGEVTSICSSGDMILLGTSKGYLYIATQSDDGRGLQKKIESCKHGSAITCLTVNNRGDFLFSGSKGRTRRLWELKDGGMILKHELHFESLLPGGVTCAQFTHDNRYLITGSNERAVTIWDIQTGALIGSQYVYAPVLDVVVTKESKLIYTSELGYVAVTKFRPPSSRKSTTKLRRDQSKSTACNIM